MKSIEAWVAAEQIILEKKKLQEWGKKSQDANTNSADKLSGSKNTQKEEENKTKEGEKEEKNPLSNTLPEVLQAMGNDEELLSLMKLQPGVSPEQFIAELKKITEKSDQEPSTKNTGNSTWGFVQSITPLLSEMFASYTVAQDRLSEQLRLHQITEKIHDDLSWKIKLAQTKLKTLKVSLVNAEQKNYV